MPKIVWGSLVFGFLSFGQMILLVEVLIITFIVKALVRALIESSFARYTAAVTVGLVAFVLVYRGF